jgi:hypothetical protein
VRFSNSQDNVELLSEKEINSRKNTNDPVLFKVFPDKENVDSFIVEDCSKTGKYGDPIDKLWLVIKNLKRDGVKEVNAS